MINKKISILCLCAIAFSEPSMGNNTSIHPSLYAGVLGGWGSTTWNGLVPEKGKQNLAINMSTPINVKEGGGVWGALLGYEFTPFFAIEGNYLHYPEATVTFDPQSLFTLFHNGLTTYRTKTETLNLMAKVMMFIPHSSVRVYSSAGIANLHREDIVLDNWRVSPTFGVGLNYHLSPRVMTELAANYTVGYGESQINPTNSFFPFLYSVTARIAYTFS